MNLYLKNYKNMLGIQGIDLKAIVNSCLELNYEKNTHINDNVENRKQWPPFVKAFAAFVLSHHRVPSQKEFFRYYVGFYYRFFLPHAIEECVYKALKGRLARMYPSLVRDIHFACSIKMNRNDLDVFYDPRLDIENDIDVLVVEDGAFKAFALYTETSRSKKYRKKKFKRHKRFDNVEYYEMALSLEGVSADKVGLYKVSSFIDKPLNEWRFMEV